MAETRWEKIRRLRMETAAMEDSVDQFWAKMRDELGLLSEIVDGLPEGVVRDAVTLVIVQTTLNGIRRDWDEHEVNGRPEE